jgi:hypothetical protein
MANPRYQMLISFGFSETECDSFSPTAVAISESPAAVELGSCSLSRTAASGPTDMLKSLVPTASLTIREVDGDADSSNRTCERSS